MLLVMLLHPPCLRHLQTTSRLFKCTYSRRNATLHGRRRQAKSWLIFKGVCGSSWGILSLRRHGLSLWARIWGLFLPSRGKSVPPECKLPPHAISWSALCFPRLPRVLSGALGPPLFTPHGLLAPLIALPRAMPQGTPAYVQALLASKPFI